MSCKNRICKDLGRLEELKGDPEAAHGAEDVLRECVLICISQGKCVDPKGCAGLALLTQRVDFPRWCA